MAAARQRALPRWLLIVVAALGLTWGVLAITSGGRRSVVVPTNAELGAGAKPILYHFSAEWCGPCRRMEGEVFDDDATGAFIAGRFTRVDVLDRSREEGRNSARVEELERRYGVRAFPTLVIASPEGTQLRRLEGYPGRAGTLDFLHQGDAEPADRPDGAQAPG